ncbi:SWI/SNF-related matrix-associated actin-dependent regulator of chromatin subfamily A containing DEAD/H box 1-like [Pterocles gutturalis]
MSLYNLDRFRFERNRKVSEEASVSPSAAQAQAGGSAVAGSAAGGGEDEAADDSSRAGTPASDGTEVTGYSAVPETPEAKRTKKKSYFKHQRGVRFLDVSSSDSEDEQPRNFSAAKENRAPRRYAIIISDDEEPEDQLPQLVCTNDGDQLPAVKKGVEGDVRDAKLQTLKEHFPQTSDQELLQLDESEPERQWERQEMLVKKLQKIFPALDDEELRDVLQEHNWVFQEALESLRVLVEDVEGKERFIIHFILR